MASTSSAVEEPQEERRPFYCHHCAHQWMKALNSQFECPQCHQGFIEEVTESFQPVPSELPAAELVPRSPFLNLFFYQNELEMEDPAGSSRRRRPRQSARMSTGGATNRQRSSRSRSPHVSVLVESNNGNAFRIGINAGARVSANRLLSVAIDDIMDSFFAPGLTTRPPAMTEEQLQEIPKVTITEEQVQSELMCSVCFDDFQTNESENRKLQCEHIFHERCIFPWLKTNASCPVCRTKLSNAAPAVDNDDEDFASLIRVISDYQRSRQARAVSGPSTSRARQARERISSSDDSDINQPIAGPMPEIARLPRVPRIRGPPHPLTQRARRAHGASAIERPSVPTFQRQTRSRALLNQARIATVRAESAHPGPSTSAPVEAMLEIEQSTSSFASENYRTARAARVARLTARTRIAELANPSNSSRPILLPPIAGQMPTRFTQRRNAVDSPRPPPLSMIPRPVRAARMNPTVGDSDNSDSLEARLNNSTSSESLSLPRPQRHLFPLRHALRSAELAPILSELPSPRSNRMRHLDVAFRDAADN